MTTIMFALKVLLCFIAIHVSECQFFDDDQFEKDFENSFRGLDGLGERIQKQVYQSLEPVRIMESEMNVRNGNGGYTVATFVPSQQIRVIKNGNSYVCTGSINNGECSNLQKTEIKNKEDFCFKQNAGSTIINGYICLFADSSSQQVSVINGVIQCESGDNSFVLMTTLEKFREMCKNLATSVKFTYYPQNTFISASKKVTCTEGSPTVCYMSELVPFFASTTQFN